MTPPATRTNPRSARLPRCANRFLLALLSGIFFMAMAGFSRAAVETVVVPPGELPVKVKVAFCLLNLTRVEEKNEQFEADIYLVFMWKDERLKHDGKGPILYTNEAVQEKLEEIWSPQLEFVNTAKPEITNQNLIIAPDGAVGLKLGLTSTFRADLDLRRFPFDHQRLTVRITSFIYNAEDVIFEPDLGTLTYERANTFEGLRVTGLSAEALVINTEGAVSEKFSEFRAHIDVERNAGFYVWTVFGPVILIFLISCTIYLLRPEQFSERVSICLAALLACIATQFTLSFGLPQIAYLTLIDRLFVITYGFTALNVLTVSAELLLAKRNEQVRKRVNLICGLFVPTAYLVLLAIALMH
jgi:hypothetical protein